VRVENDDVRGNINVKAVHNALEDQVRKGRSAVEAAGESRWMADVELKNQLHAPSTHAELVGVIDEWLAEKVGVPIDEIGPYAMAAQSYANFLAERVQFADPQSPHPIAQLESAWQEWRQTRGGG
jgi:hypothetical protein